MKKQVFNVGGMVCNGCKYNVEKTLKALAGVEKAEANLGDKNVSVEYDETKVQPEDMKKAVAESGNYVMEV